MADSDQSLQSRSPPTAPTPATTQDLGHQMAKAKKLSPED
jgi:hypothetical protein